MKYNVIAFYRKPTGKRLGTTENVQLARSTFSGDQLSVWKATEAARKLFPDADSLTVEEAK